MDLNKSRSHRVHGHHGSDALLVGGAYVRGAMAQRGELQPEPLRDDVGGVAEDVVAVAQQLRDECKAGDGQQRKDQHVVVVHHEVAQSNYEMND